MSRVVPDQRKTFENDEFFRKLSRESEVRNLCFQRIIINCVKLFRDFLRSVPLILSAPVFKLKKSDYLGN